MPALSAFCGVPLYCDAGLYPGVSDVVADEKDENSPGRGEERRCPGEKYSITPAICRARQRNHYPKCLLCKWHDLQNDYNVQSDPKVKTDIFRNTCVAGQYPSEVNEHVVRKVGAAVAQLLRAGTTSPGSVAVTYDMRASSRGLSRALGEGINHGGLHALNAGIAPEEVLHFVMGTEECAGGIHVSAGNRRDGVNGLRIFHQDGSRMHFSNGLDKVGLIARRLKSGRSRVQGERGFADPLDDYRSYVLKFAPGLGHLRVAADASCGVMSRTLPFVFRELPVDLLTSHFDSERYKEFLGQRFPSEELKSHMKKGMRRANVDLGAAFDFAGDRVAFFDENGDMVRNDAIAAMVASELLHRHQGGRVIYDLRCSAALREQILKADGQPLSCPTGTTAVASQVRQKDALYGTDGTGRHFFREFFRSNSPTVALLLVCSYLNRNETSLSAFNRRFTKYSHSGELRIKMPSQKVAENALEKLKVEFKDADRDLLDGLTVRLKGWWFNLRRRPNSAELRLNVEGRSDAELRRGREKIVSRIKDAAGVSS